MAALVACSLAVALFLSPAVAGGFDTALEQHIGRIAAAALEAETGVVESAFLEEWIGGIGRDIAAASRRKGLKFRFKVLASPEVNALALPGGHVYVCRGLLNRLGSESELAGVLGHEVAHLHSKDFQRVLERQLVFLGLMGLLRKKTDSPPAELGLAVVQVLDILRHSRKREYQADAAGIELAFKAGHDPGGVVEFLEHISAGRGERGRLADILATHPPAAQRLARARTIVQAAERSDHDRLMRLADHLARRGFSHRPLQLYETAAEVRPDDPEPHARRGEILTRRGLLAEAAGAFETAAHLADDDTYSARARALRETPAAPEPATRPLPAASADRLARLERDLRDRSRANRAVWAHLSANVRRMRDDDRIQMALTYGQAIDAEWDSLRFMGSVAAAWLLLRRCLRWPDDALELAWRESETRGGLGRLARGARTVNVGADEEHVAALVTRLDETALVTADRAADALETLLPHSDEVREAAVQCSVVLLSLLGTGRNQLFGELNWSRFAVNNAFLLRANGRMERAEGALSEAQAAITDAAVDVFAAELDWEGAQAPPRSRHPYAALLAPRFGLGQDELLRLWHESGGLGRAVDAAARDAVTGDQPAAAREARFILMRLAGNELAAEKLPPQWAAQQTGG